MRNAGRRFRGILPSTRRAVMSHCGPILKNPASSQYRPSTRSTGTPIERRAASSTPVASRPVPRAKLCSKRTEPRWVER